MKHVTIVIRSTDAEIEVESNFTDIKKNGSTPMLIRSFLNILIVYSIFFTL